MNNTIFLIGCGPGDGERLTAEAINIIRRSELVLGTERVLSGVRAYLGEAISKPEATGQILPEGEAPDTEEAICAGEDAAKGNWIYTKTYTEDALNLILKYQKKKTKSNCQDRTETGNSGGKTDTISVLYSGDSGFYSGAGKLSELLLKEGLTCEYIPGISSLQYFAAKLQENWQDWLLLSVHGKTCNILKEICKGKPVFLLTGSIAGGLRILKELVGTGLSELPAAAGVKLSYPEESIIKGTAAEVLEALENKGGSSSAEAGLLVLLIYPPIHYNYRSPGISDEEFTRGGRPMTKRAVRALVMSALQVGENDTVLDIGAGTGGMSIELSMQAGTVYAVEKEEEGIRLLGENKRKFGAWNLHIIKGIAPEALYGELKGVRADKVFIGGNDGNLPEILNAVRELYEGAEICLTAVTLETVSEALLWFDASDYRTEITQITAANSVEAGRKHLMKGENPVYIITGKKAAALSDGLKDKAVC